ncbi:MAG: hypothetical protein ACM32E_12185 [Gemmatimonadota bacterium]
MCASGLRAGLHEPAGGEPSFMPAIAGPGIIANSASVPLAAIYEVRCAPQPLPGVSLELALWTGNELTHILTADPADLPDLTAYEPTSADDALFSAR